jgi:hypothetical protein
MTCSKGKKVHSGALEPEIRFPMEELMTPGLEHMNYPVLLIKPLFLSHLATLLPLKKHAQARALIALREGKMARNIRSLKLLEKVLKSLLTLQDQANMISSLRLLPLLNSVQRLELYLTQREEYQVLEPTPCQVTPALNTLYKAEEQSLLLLKLQALVNMIKLSHSKYQKEPQIGVSRRTVRD